MNIEDVFSSRLRMKLLRILAQVSELNSSDIARRLGVNYKTASGHLRVLEEEGILQHKTFGRIRLYRFKERSPKAKIVQTFIEEWEKVDKT